MKELKLTRGQVALVDDEDFEYLNQFKWHASFDPKLKRFYVVYNRYLGRCGGKELRKTIKMHRLIMSHHMERDLHRKEIVDHINHNSLDNRKTNLRVVSNRQNLQNLEHKGTSKYPGVYLDKTSKKWRAQIRINGKREHLGLFGDEREAAMAYERACRDLGEELVCKISK